MLQNLLQRLRNRASVSAGLFAGLIGVIVSFAGHGLIPGRVLGDPLPLALAFGQIMRSLLYFNWRGLLWHLLFAILLGVLAVVLLRWLTPVEPLAGDVAQAASIAAIVNLVVVALTEVDALMVAFWYLMASFISYMVTITVARRVGLWLTERQSA